MFNHIGIRATKILTDFSGYLIFAVAIILTVCMLAYAPSIDIGRRFTLTNYTGDPGGGAWPHTDSLLMAFLLGWIVICSFVLAMPNVSGAAKQGGNVFYWLMAVRRCQAPSRGFSISAS